MEYGLEANLFQQCKYIHEVELVNMKLQMRILETHLETKDRLLRNLEEIIDEQEGRIANMEDFIQAPTQYCPSTRSYPQIAQAMKDDGHLKKLQRFAQDLKAEKDELRQLAMDTKEAFSVCMTEMKMMLDSKLLTSSEY